MESAPNKPNQPTEQFNVGSSMYTSRKDHRFMFALSIIIIVGLILGVAFAHHTNNANPMPVSSSTVLPAAQVTITANGFNPATIKVKQGQTVTWTNQDSKPHQPASDPYPAENAVPGFVDDTALPTGATYGFKFNQAGTFTYHDHLNPLQFKGTVIVEQ